MKRIAGSDAVFLAAETPTWHQHVGGIVVLEPSATFSYERVVEEVRARIVNLPRFTYRVKETPLGLDRPVWVDDPHFDVERHMIRAACPHPGDMRALCSMAGRIFSQQLDRRRPLWEAWVVEGLDDGGTALIVKWHHALADGTSGVAIAELLLDLERDPTPRPTTAPETAGDAPSDLELLVRSFWPPYRPTRNLVRYVGQQVRRAGTIVPVLRHAPVVAPMSAPKVGWNGNLGPHRVVVLGSVSLADVKRVKDHFGVTVNDVMIAVIGSSVRRYLEKYESVPAKPLVAGMPFSTRTDDDTEISNKVSAALVSLATDLDDPVARLRAIHESTGGAKALQRAMRSRTVPSIGEATPPALIGLVSRTITRMGIEGAVPASGNVIISDIPGPPFPLYACGARVRGMYPMAPIMFGGGLNATLVSYDGEMQIGFLGDADLLEDPWMLVEGLAPSLQELVDAVDA